MRKFRQNHGKRTQSQHFSPTLVKKLYGEIEVLEVHFFEEKKLCVLHVMNTVFKEEKTHSKKVESIRNNKISAGLKTQFMSCITSKEKMLCSACYKQSVQISSP